MTLSDVAKVAVPLFLTYLAPALLHAAFSPDPTSKLGGWMRRARKLGFDPTAFEAEETRLLKVLAEKAAK